MATAIRPIPIKITNLPSISKDFKEEYTSLVDSMSLWANTAKNELDSETQFINLSKFLQKNEIVIYPRELVISYLNHITVKLNRSLNIFQNRNHFFRWEWIQIKGKPFGDGLSRTGVISVKIGHLRSDINMGFISRELNFYPDILPIEALRIMKKIYDYDNNLNFYVSYVESVKRPEITIDPFLLVTTNTDFLKGYIVAQWDNPGFSINNAQKTK